MSVFVNLSPTVRTRNRRFLVGIVLAVILIEFVLVELVGKLIVVHGFVSHGPTLSAGDWATSGGSPCSDRLKIYMTRT